MYNSSKLAVGGTGGAALAATGSESWLALTLIALVLISVGGIVLLLKSRTAKRRVISELS